MMDRISRVLISFPSFLWVNVQASFFPGLILLNEWSVIVRLIAFDILVQARLNSSVFFFSTKKLLHRTGEESHERVTGDLSNDVQGKWPESMISFLFCSSATVVTSGAPAFDFAVTGNKSYRPLTFTEKVFGDDWTKKPTTNNNNHSKESPTHQQKQGLSPQSELTVIYPDEIVSHRQLWKVSENHGHLLSLIRRMTSTAYRNLLSANEASAGNPFGHACQRWLISLLFWVDLK